jgi:photosystem II stability/assembly factor-like uncharacterized protein
MGEVPQGTFFDGVRWRLIGPYRGGRVVAVAGDAVEPRTFYFGSTGGGVWKTEDSGISWRNVSDGFFRRASVGALALAPSDRKVIYAGMGECSIRSNVSHGDGVYRSTDGGETWAHRGLAPTRHIGRVRVHPTDPDLVYVAALGHAHGPNPERGVYRSRDGGGSWTLVLHHGPDSGAVDLVMDPYNPRRLYASFWETRRLPWRLDSGGEGSGLWRSDDGGDSWVEISRKRGLPRGVLGKIGIAASPAREGRLWAIVEAEDGAVFGSDDAGEHWARLSEQADLRYRAWYYQHIFADPLDPETVWALNIDIWRSPDAGRTFEKVPVPHGDAHDLWFDPADSRRLIMGSDGGANVSLDGGHTWSSFFNQPTAELYHAIADTRQPYRVLAAQQDNTTISIPSHSELGVITNLDVNTVGGGESGYIAVRPDDPDIVFAGNYLGTITRYDYSRRTARGINVWPESTIGAGADQARYRFNWTAPILISPHDPNVLYQAGNRVFRSRDEGFSWEPISPDLSRNDPEKLRSSGGQLTQDNTGAEYVCTVFALAESSITQGLLWAGTDDGRVHVTRDGGTHWTDVTPPDMPVWTCVSSIEPSGHDEGTAYVAAERHRLDDFRPYLWRTRDHGASWQRLDGGLPDEEFCRVLREDGGRPGLLYCGTEAGVYVSFDDGGSWRSIRSNLPVTPVHDLVVKDDDLIAATHGRSIWILDDLPAVRAYQPDDEDGSGHLFAPRRLVQYPSGMELKGPIGIRSYAWAGVTVVPFDTRHDPASEEGLPVLVDAGENRASGVSVLYWLRDPAEDELELTFLGSEGEVIRHCTARPGDETRKPEPGRPKDRRPPRESGLNHFVWDTRHDRGTLIEVDPPPEGQGFETVGPAVPPGAYQVRLRVGGFEQVQRFEIAKDPRNPATPEDLEARYQLSLRVWRRIGDLNGAVNTIRRTRHQLERWLPPEDAKDPSELQAAARSLHESLGQIESELVLVNPKGSPRLSNPDRLEGKLHTLGGHIDVAARPTAAATELADELSHRLDVQLGRLTDLFDGPLGDFNRKVREAGAAAIDPEAGSR